MVVEADTHLKLSIWRNAPPGRTLVLRESGSDSHRVLGSDSELLEEVYSWHLREDPFAGISDECVRDRLRELLVQRLDASHAPAERSLSVLDDFVVEAIRAIDDRVAGKSPIQNPPVHDDGESHKINTLLALARHLKWLSRCFANRPGISVSIR